MRQSEMEVQVAQGERRRWVGGEAAGQCSDIMNDFRIMRRTKSRRGLADDFQRLFEVLEKHGGGSVLRGWRLLLDQDGSLKVGIKDFAKVVADLSLQMDIARLVDSEKDPSFYLIDLAPVQAGLLNRFREWVKKQFGGPAGMFTALDVDGLEYITREAFVSGCKDMKFKASLEEFEELFNCLDFDSGGSVTMDEVMFLELDPVIRDQEMFKLKMRSRFERQRLRAFAHCEDIQRYDAKHRRGQRGWLANEFENLPVLVVQRRLEHHQLMYKKSVQAQVAFLKELRDAYGNEVRAWRRALDPDCTFFLNKVQLRQILRRSDMPIDFDALWRGMDRDGDESITLEEISPGAGLQLALFRSWCHVNFGSCAAVWDLPRVTEARTKAVESGRWASDKKMMVPVLAGVLNKIGWQCDAHSVLFQCMDLYGCNFVSLPDLWWLDLWKPPEWLAARPDPQALIELQCCVQVLCSHPLVAWRSILDVDSDNLVSWTEFQNGCKKLKFQGSVGGAWRMLDKDVSGTITLAEWDPKAAELLGSFKAWAETNFGSVELAFKAFDKEGSGSVTLNDLKGACRRLKWDGDVKALFKGLICKGSSAEEKKNMTLKDVIFLDKWVDHDEMLWALQNMEGGAPGAVDEQGRSQLSQMKRANSKSRSSFMSPCGSSKDSPQTRSKSPKSPKRMSRSPSSRDLWAKEQEASSPKSQHSRASSVSGKAKGGGGSAALPVEHSESEKLLRSYHVLAHSKKPRYWDSKVAKLRSQSTSALPWLDKINRIDEVYSHTAVAA